MPNTDDVIPLWFQYDANGDLELNATLAAAPSDLDAKCPFFRDVPDWYEVTELSEVEEAIGQLKNAKPEEKGDMSDADVAEMLENFTRMRSYIEAYNRPALTDTQKELLRAICYWASVKTMAEIPQDDED